MNQTADELAIRNLVARYADAVNRYDAETWGATWAEDAEWNLRPGESRTGRRAIMEFWNAIMATLEFAIMIPGSGQVSIHGDQASGRWYMLEIVEEKHGRGSHITGVYNDHYRKINGQWHIQSRQYHMLYETPASSEGIYRTMPVEQQVKL